MAIFSVIPSKCCHERNEKKKLTKNEIPPPTHKKNLIRNTTRLESFLQPTSRHCVQDIKETRIHRVVHSGLNKSRPVEVSRARKRFTLSRRPGLVPPIYFFPARKRRICGFDPLCTRAKSSSLIADRGKS